MEGCRSVILIMLVFLKILHTIIWAIVTASNFVAFYFAFIGRFDIWFWIPALLVVLEIIVIMLNDWKCPITNLVEKYTKVRSGNYGIYLPGWLAKYNVRIYSVLIPLEVVIVVIKRFF